MAAEHLQDLLPRIFGLVPPLEFIQSIAASCRQFSPSWYFALFPRCVVVPDEVQSINAAINRLGALAEEGTSLEETRQGPSRGLVLIRPGTYSESVRVTQNCYILGLGGKGTSRGQAVVEAPGWESALVFSGLGVSGFGSGEDACVANVTFRCRNEQMRGRCAYIVLGQPSIECCDIEGGVHVAGRHTAPRFHRCRVHASWGSGVHLTDHCRGSLKESAIAGNRRHGILVDRGSQPEVASNQISDNTACGIRIFFGIGQAWHSNYRQDVVSGLPTLKRIRDNQLEGNGDAGLSTTPRFADIEELEVDADEEEEDDVEEQTTSTVFAPVGAEDINWPSQ